MRTKISLYSLALIIAVLYALDVILYGNILTYRTIFVLAAYTSLFLALKLIYRIDLNLSHISLKLEAINSGALGER